MKVALYARVSTEDKGQDPETQLIRLRALSTARGYEVVKEYVDFKSGKDQNRPAFQEMLADAKAHKFDLILIVRIDRIMRSLKNLLLIIEKLEGYHVGLECSDQDISTKGAMGRLMINLLGAFAEFERELIRDRTLAGLERARQEGKTLGRPVVSDAKASERTLRRRRAAANKGAPLSLNIEGGKT